MSANTRASTVGSRTSVAATHHAKKRNRKSCSVLHCMKMDAGGGLCVAHGGGKQCSYPDCSKGSQTGGFCRQHGGGARCTMDGCTKVDAGKGLCRAHGGGKRCQYAECKKADVGGGYCTAHGGGKRCSEVGCNKVHQGNGRCRAHGGARRCQHVDCNQLARGITGYCSAHGGALLCSMPNCRRMARVEQGTMCYTCDQERRQQSETTTVVEPSPLDRLRTIQSVSDTSSTSNDSTVNSPSCNEQRPYGAGCLDNGCSRVFGGECNCKDGCSCCEPLNQPVPTPPPSLQPSRSSLVLHRIVVHIGQTQCVIPLSAIRAMLSSLDKVLTAHELITSVSLAAAFVLVCEPNMNWTILETILDTVCGRIISTSTIHWSWKEVVLHVPDMMCPGNCRQAVVGAIEQVPLVASAQLVFEPRYVVVRGDMSADALVSAVDDVGFQATVIATTPLMKTYRFHVTNLTSVHLTWFTRLQPALEKVEGVKTVLLDIDQSLVMVQGVLQDHGVLNGAALTSSGVLMVEEGQQSTIGTEEVVDPRSASLQHVCDATVCVTGRCPQYQAKVAHTAALAVGWVVPGCPMSWGGECTCGEKCKCVGCPQHNPIHRLL